MTEDTARHTVEAESPPAAPAESVVAPTAPADSGLPAPSAPKPHRNPLLSDPAARWTSRLLLIALWFLAGTVGSRIPTPTKTIQFIIDEFQRPYGRNDWSILNNELVHNLLVSLGRAGIALTLILVVGVLVGFAMGRWWRAQAFFTDLVIVGIALPAFIWALLAVMWFGFGSKAPIFVAFISATPMLVVSVQQGSFAVPRELRDMSNAYGVPFKEQARHLVLPSMAGYISAGFRVAVLAAWGAVMLVEWFGNNQGAGYRAHYWYDAGNFNGLMGWGLIILAVVITVDRLVLERMKRASTRWRSGIGELGSSGAKAAISGTGDDDKPTLGRT